MRVLVTGASGFIGQYCIALLSGRGSDVHAVGRQPPQNSTNVIWHAVDLVAPGAVSRLVEEVKPTHLLHLAWYTVPKKYWSAPENLEWVAASLLLAREFARHGGKRAIFAGTCAEYEWVEGRYSEYVTPCRPTSFFGLCKHGLHTLVDRFATEAGLSHAWARIFFLYGPHEHPARLVAAATRSLLVGEHAQCSPGLHSRDFLHVEDAARALVALLKSEVIGPVNIASGQPVAIREIAAKIGDILGCRDRVDFGALPAPSNEPLVMYADTARLAREVGWNPVYTLDFGLRHTVEWWKNSLKREDGIKTEEAL